jgi:hypothetical protein
MQEGIPVRLSLLERLSYVVGVQHVDRGAHNLQNIGQDLRVHELGSRV